MPLAPPVIKIVLLLSFIVKYPSKLWDHRQSCEEALRRSTRTQTRPAARWHVIDRPSAHAGERLHDDAIGQIHVAHADLGKERLDGHAGAPGQGIKRRRRFCRLAPPPRCSDGRQRSISQLTN